LVLHFFCLLYHLLFNPLNPSNSLSTKTNRISELKIGILSSKINPRFVYPKAKAMRTIAQQSLFFPSKTCTSKLSFLAYPINDVSKSSVQKRSYNFFLGSQNIIKSVRCLQVHKKYSRENRTRKSWLLITKGKTKAVVPRYKVLKKKYLISSNVLSRSSKFL